MLHVRIHVYTCMYMYNVQCTYVSHAHTVHERAYVTGAIGATGAIDATAWVLLMYIVHVHVCIHVPNCTYTCTCIIHVP